MKCRKSQRGFTLVELLITVVILVILASIALPSYRSFVAKSIRTQAKSALLLVADRQEQFFLDNKAYATDLTSLGFGATPMYIDRDGFEVGADSGDQVYSISFQQATAIEFTAAATPVAAQAEADSACGTLLLDNTGRRDQSGTAHDCW